MAHRIRQLVTTLVLSASTVACVSSTAPEEALSVAPTATRFVRDSSGFVQISFRVTNAGNTAVYLATCSGVVSADVQSNSATPALSSSANSLICLSPLDAGPYELRPGQTIQGNRRGRILPGDYRLRVPVRLRRDGAANRSAFSSVITVG